MKECQCRPFFMPSRKNGDDFQVDQLPFCTGSKIKCMFEVISDVEGAEGAEGAAYVVPKDDESQKWDVATLVQHKKVW